MTFETLEKNNPWFSWVTKNRPEYFKLCGKRYHVDSNLLQELASWYIQQHDQTIARMTRTHTTPKIPKKIHFIWLGAAIPEWRSRMITCWQEIHPGWEVWLWNEQAIQSAFPFGFENQIIFDQATQIKNYGKASDIARYEILRKYGGLYVDSDVMCLQNMTVFHENFSFYAGVEFFSGLIIGNAVIGSTPHHPIIEACIKDARNAHPQNYFEHYNAIPDLLALWIPLDENQSKDVYQEEVFTIISTGPSALTRAICTTIHENKNNPTLLDDICIAPSTYFYPDFGSKFSNSRRTFCCHYAEHDWTKSISLKGTPNENF